MLPAAFDEVAAGPGTFEAADEVLEAPVAFEMVDGCMVMAAMEEMTEL